MSQETSLARQLRKLAVPQTNLLLIDKIRPSLLFDPKEASGLDRDTIFSYGSTGFEKLTLINDAFSAFEDVLFSESSKSFERSVQTRQVNKNLDETIDKFLTMLSPYVLLRSAHEALEWLVYRFHVHMFNVDALIGCVLSHYNTNVFVRVIQLLDLKDSSGRWHWLSHIQKTGQPLELKILMHHFKSDRGFHAFVADLATNIIKCYPSQPNACQTVISFSVIMTYYSIKQTDRLDSGFVSFIFSYVMKGLKSGLSSYVAGTYLVISSLVTKEKLSSDVLEGLMIKILENVKSELTTQAIELVALMFEHQDVGSLSKNLLSLIYFQEELKTALYHMCGQSIYLKLIKAVIRRSIPFALKAPTSNNKKLEFVVNLLQNASLDDDSIQSYFDAILRFYVKLCTKATTKTTSKHYLQSAKPLLNCLEARWPDKLDGFIEDYFKQTRPEVEQKLVWCLLNFTMSSLKHQVLEDSKMTLYLAINHPNNGIRSNAVKVLIGDIMAKKVTDVEFVKESFVNRLQDDDATIALRVLKYHRSFKNLFTDQELQDALIQTLKINVRKKSSKRQKICQAIINILCSEPNDTDTTNYPLLEVVLPFLIPLVLDDICITEMLLETPFARNHVILKHVGNECLSVIKASSRHDTGSLAAITVVILSAFQKSLQLATSDVTSSLSHFFLQVVNGESVDARVSLFAITAIECLYNLKIQDSDVCVESLAAMLSYFDRLLRTEDIHVDDYDHNQELTSAISDCIKQLRKNQLTQTVCCHVVRRIIETHPIWDLSDQDGSHFKAVLNLFEFLIRFVHGSKFQLVFQKLLTLFFSHLFPNMKSRLRFLSFFWISSSPFRNVALKMASMFIVSNVSFDWFFSEDALEFPFLLVAMSSEDDNTRLKAVSLLIEHLLPSCSRCELPMKSVANVLAKHKEEIIADHIQLISVLDVWLSSEFHCVLDSSSESSQDLPSHVLKTFIKISCNFATPSKVTHLILKILRGLDSSETLYQFLPVLKHYLTLYQSSKLPLDATEIGVIELLLQKFSPSSVSKFSKSSDELDTFMEFLKTTRGTCDYRVQEMTLSRITKDFFAAIPSLDVQQNLFDTLVEMCINSESTEINININRALRKICSSAFILLKDLPGDSSIHKTTTVKEAKLSKHKDNTFSAEVLTKGPWKKITIVLEIIQSKKLLNSCDLLVLELFRLLNLTIDWPSQTSIEYVRQLLLASIYNCCQQLGIDSLEESKFQVELVIQCIRCSQSSKTHYQALLLLNLASTMFPDLVLNNIMSIFTFMGTNLVHQDDSFSFQVISQTIETIIPALQETSQHQEHSDKLQIMASIIRLFVSSIPDIPKHRQLPLFLKLVNTLGSSSYLWVPLAQICERYADPSSSQEASSPLELAASLQEQFSLNIQLETCLSFLNHLVMLPHSLEELKKLEKSVEPFDFMTHTDKQLDEYKSNCIRHMNQWLSSPQLIEQVLESDVSRHGNLEPLYKELVEQTLSYLQQETNAPSSTSKAERINLLYELLCNVNTLLPCKLFLRVLKKLLTNSSIPSVQRKAIEMLNSRLEQQPKLFSENQDALLKLLKPLLKLFADAREDSERDLDMQTALYSVHLMCKTVGSEHPTKFRKVLSVIIDVLNCEESNPKLLVSALLCLAELTACLNALILPYLNSFFPRVLVLIEDHSKFFNDEFLSLGILAALYGLIENLAPFLSNYMEVVIRNVCRLVIQCQVTSRTSIQEKLKSLCELLSTEVTPRVLIPSIELSYADLLKMENAAVGPLATILGRRISKSEPVDLVDYLLPLQNYFLQLLGYRNDAAGSSNDAIDLVEDQIIDSVLALVMKLSEPTFQSFFGEIYRWAVPSSVDQVSDIEKDRVFAFYHLTFALSKNLKSIFVGFGKKFMRHCATVLDANNSSKSDDSYFDCDEKSAKFLNYVLDTLNFCFMYDDGQLSDKEGFNVLMQPLVDQIENSLGGDEFYQDRIENHLSTCIAHFITVFSDNSLWKALNYQVLLKTRHSSSKVRFASLQVIRELVRKMHDNYLALLPESIPFLAEIMEDESFEVEQECQDVIMEMEKILGEPIKKYF